MSDDIEINLDDPEDINIAIDDDSPVSVEMPEGGMDGRSIHPAGEWSDTAEYAYLDLVTHEGSSYTAVRAVPAGTVLTDTYYWQLTAEKGDPGDPGTPNWGAITGDLSDQTDLQEALDGKAPVILSSASGSIASFSDGSASPVTALSVGIDPVQDLHGYGNPWPAGGGANVMPQFVVGTYTADGITAVVDANGKITVTGEKTTSSAVNLNLPLSITPYAIQNGYYLHLRNSQRQPSIALDIAGASLTFSEANRIWQNTTERTPGSNCKLYFASSVSGTLNFTLQPSVEATGDVTSWTPYSNICPISGRTSATVTRMGKNLIDIADYTSTSNARVVNTTGVYLKAGTYTVSFDFSTTGTEKRVQIVVKKDSTIAQGNYTLTGEVAAALVNCTVGRNQATLVCPQEGYLYMRLLGNGASASNIQAELGSSASAYEAPQIQSVTIDLDGTRYGGSLNVLTGQMTVTKAIVNLGTLSWSYESTNKFFYANVSGGVSNYGISVLPNIICSIYKTVTTRYSANWNYDSANGCISWSRDSSRVECKNTAYTSASDFKSAMSGQTLVYELATPLTVQLSQSQMQTLLGENHIWTDTGDTEVTYRADTKLYIQKLTKPTEDDMIANNNIAANTFFMVGNNLYFATSAIATGTTIVPGQNCTALSLAEALNNLNA